MRTGADTYESIVTATNAGIGTNHIVNTAGFYLDTILRYGANTTVSNGNFSGSQRFLTHTNIDFRYSCNCGTTLTAKKPVYLVGTFTNGKFYLDTTQWYSQNLPISKDDKIYIYLGIAYNAYCITLENAHPIYWYVNSHVELYNPIYDLSNDEHLSGTLPFSKGGTGQITGTNAANSLINQLTIENTDPQDNDYFISQYAGGSQSTFHKRPISKLWNYIKTKLGTAAYKNIPSSGNASSTQVVMGNDSRLSNARPSSDVVQTYNPASIVPISGQGVAEALNTLPAPIAPASTNPSNLGVIASVGTSESYARADHIHKTIPTFFYGTTSTASTETVKIVSTLDSTVNFSLITGNCIAVRFSSNSGGITGAFSLNVDSTGAKPVSVSSFTSGSDGGFTATELINQSDVALFMYISESGGYYRFLGSMPNGGRVWNFKTLKPGTIMASNYYISTNTNPLYSMGTFSDVTVTLSDTLWTPVQGGSSSTGAVDIKYSKVGNIYYINELLTFYSRSGNNATIPSITIALPNASSNFSLTGSIDEIANTYSRTNKATYANNAYTFTYSGSPSSQNHAITFHLQGFYQSS